MFHLSIKNVGWEPEFELDFKHPTPLLAAKYLAWHIS